MSNQYDIWPDYREIKTLKFYCWVKEMLKMRLVLMHQIISLINSNLHKSRQESS